MLKIFQRKSYLHKLHAYSRRGDARAIRKLLSTGSHVDDLDATGRTALCIAAKYGKLEVMEVLIEAGANIDFMPNDGRAPIYQAIYSGSDEAVQLLVEKGANVDIRDAVGYTPYQYASGRGFVNLLGILKLPTDPA